MNVLLCIPKVHLIFIFIYIHIVTPDFLFIYQKDMTLSSSFFLVEPYCQFPRIKLHNTYLDRNWVFILLIFIIIVEHTPSFAPPLFLIFE